MPETREPVTYDQPRTTPPPDTRPYRAPSAAGDERTFVEAGRRTTQRQVGWHGASGAFYALGEDVAAYERGSFSTLWVTVDSADVDNQLVARSDYDGACQTIAAMHEAATGRRGEAPCRGVVEDVADVRAAWLAAERALAETRGASRLPVCDKCQHRHVIPARCDIHGAGCPTKSCRAGDMAGQDDRHSRAPSDLTPTCDSAREREFAAIPGKRPECTVCEHRHTIHARCSVHAASCPDRACREGDLGWFLTGDAWENTGPRLPTP